jgi:hypothetical protein
VLTATTSIVGFIFIDSIGEWREMSRRTTNERPDLAVEEGAISLSLSLSAFSKRVSLSLLFGVLKIYINPKPKTLNL